MLRHDNVLKLNVNVLTRLNDLEPRDQLIKTDS